MYVKRPQYACQQMIKLLREVREARIFRVRTFVSPIAARIFNDGLTGIVESISNASGDPVERQHALSELAMGLANLASSEAVHALERLEMTGALVAIERMCTAVLDGMIQGADGTRGAGDVTHRRRHAARAVPRDRIQSVATRRDAHVIPCARCRRRRAGLARRPSGSEVL